MREITIKYTNYLSEKSTKIRQKYGFASFYDCFWKKARAAANLPHFGRRNDWGEKL
jgi:hypothetical protein